MDNLDEESKRLKYLRDLNRLNKIREAEKNKNSDNIDSDDISQKIIGNIKSDNKLENEQKSSNLDESSSRSMDVPLDDTHYKNSTPVNDAIYGEGFESSSKKTTYNNNPKTSGATLKSNNKKKKKKHRVLKTFLLLLIILAGYVGFRIYTTQKGYYTVAVFGVDSRNGNLGKDALSDVNMICQVNRESGEIRLVSIYRDTYVQINKDGTYHKFNEAYFKGGPEQAIWTLENNLDVKVDDYITFNWKAVVDGINILGGVDIEITDAEFKYINGFITETVNSTGVGSYQLEHAGMNHLDGVQAVAYARLRLMDTDYQRTQRQRKVVSLAFDKAKQADFATLSSLIAVILPQTSTSITVDDLIPFAKGISKYKLGETTGFPFDKQTMDIGKKDCVIAVTLKSNVIALHNFLYGDIPGYTYIPSSTVTSISKHIINETGLGSDDATTDVPSADNLDKQSSGGSSQGSNQQANPEPQEQATEVTQATESLEESTAESAEESESSTDESKIAETTIDETTPESDPEDVHVIEPGGGNKEDEMSGPGVAPTKPADTTTATQEIGPGVE